MMDPYERLANAIVVQAAEDYREARRTKKELDEKERMTAKDEAKYFEADKMEKDCEKFFRGDWIKALTKVDGKVILQKLREEECDE